MKFGLGERKKLSGAELAVRIIQVSSVIPALLTFLLPGYLRLMTGRNLFSVLFEVGVNAMPRAESYALSWLYRLTSSEIVLHFAMLAFALAFGLVMGALLRGKPKKAFAVRVVFALLILADIVVRLLPLKLNSAFGSFYWVLGLVVSVACLVLTVLDLIFSRRPREEEPKPAEDRPVKR